MSTPTLSPQRRWNRQTAVLIFTFQVVMFLVVLSACGSGATIDAAADAASTDEIIETSRTDATIADHTDTAIGTTVEIVHEPADERGADPFVPEAEIAECRPEELIAFLDTDPAARAAWAEAAGVAADAVADTIRSYEPAVLERDTRVTNHAYRGGRARAFQATLEAGTAVLVDDTGLPRVRCACGNPLADPRPVGEETAIDTPPPPVEATTTTVPVAVPAADFCATWAGVSPTMLGGPSDAGADAMAEYLGRLVDGFDQLIAVAQATEGFPADALTDIRTYRDAIAEAARTPGHPGPGPADVMVGIRVEEFLTTYCPDVATDEAPADDSLPPHLDGGEIDLGDDDGASSDGAAGNCGSMQFALLVLLADELAIDHAATSQPYVDAMNNLVNGFDPGPEFDVADLSIMVANEEIGCQGAQAMQQLLTDLGFGPLIEGTELGA